MPKGSTARHKQKKYMLVRYGRLNRCGQFEHREHNIPKVPTQVLVKTERGLELGSIVGQLACYREGQLKCAGQPMSTYYKESGIDMVPEPSGSFVRYATEEDLREERHLRRISSEQLRLCRQLVREMNLSMKIVDTEHTFGGERVIFYFLAEGRVDFRELVKKLAQEYQCRIEMRQIGSRDEAKLLGDLESCGQECCCRRFLKALKPVNMKMAKMQKATLDPAKISGYCGRLKCCLRYENDTYNDLKKRLPPKNSIVRFKEGSGKVVDYQILTQLVLIEKQDGTTAAVPVEEIEVESLGRGDRGGTSEQTDTDESGNNGQDGQ